MPSPRTSPPFVWALLAAALTVAVISAAPLAQAFARGDTRPAAVTAASVAEIWSQGVTLEGAAAYANVAGRLTSNVAVFRSNRSVTSMVFALPPAASAKTIQSAQVYVLSRTGIYSGAATLALRIYNLAGVAQHTVSSVSFDLQSMSTGAWLTVPLSATPADLSIAAGEYLGFEMALNAAAGDNLDVRAMFSVTVQ